MTVVKLAKSGRTDPQQTPAIQSISESLEVAKPLAFETVSKTILKLAEAAIPNRLSSTSEISPAVEEAMQRLVAIVAKVRSTEGGWPSDLPQTLENLMPYVTEEAYEVIEALKERQTADSRPQKGQTNNRFHNSRYILVEDLIPRLLWYMARSSEDLMRLLSGVKARLLGADGDWSAGMLRLRAILEADASDVHWFVDLATQQLLSYPDDTYRVWSPLATIQLDDGYTGAIAVENFAQQLGQEILAATPEIRIFLESTSVHLLEPGNIWQSGKIHLKLDFEFIGDNNDNVEVAGAIEWENTKYKIQNPKSADAVQTKVKFTEPILLEQYSQSLIRQHLSGAIAHLITLPQSPDLLTSKPLISNLVKAAYTLADIIQTPTTDMPAFLVMGLDELRHRLLWQLVGSSYEVMQLMGGVKANVLQPEYRWLMGTLHSRAKLKVTAADLNWDLDLTTGQVPESNCLVLPPNAIAQSYEIRLLQQPAQTDSLLKWLRRQIINTIPEIQLLMDGTQVEFQEGDRDWQSVFLELSLDIKFIPYFISS